MRLLLQMGILGVVVARRAVSTVLSPFASTRWGYLLFRNHTPYGYVRYQCPFGCRHDLNRSERATPPARGLRHPSRSAMLSDAAVRGSRDATDRFRFDVTALDHER